MKRHGVPTADYETFTDAAPRMPTSTARARRSSSRPTACRGKGVVVAQSAEEAHAAVDAMLADNKLGAAGARVVIEELLAGEEASFIVMSDGRNVLAMATSQDHKRLLDGDQGPNTGGMGVYSPAPIVTPSLHAKASGEIIQRTVNGMAADGIEFTGFPCG